MPSIKNCFVVDTTYSPDAATRREPFRAEHLARLEKLYLEGALVAAGVFDDLRSGLVMLQVESEEAAAAVIETDVYFRNGVWTDYRVRRFSLVTTDE